MCAGRALRVGPAILWVRGHANAVDARYVIDVAAVGVGEAAARRNAHAGHGVVVAIGVARADANAATLLSVAAVAVAPTSIGHRVETERVHTMQRGIVTALGIRRAANWKPTISRRPAAGRCAACSDAHATCARTRARSDDQRGPSGARQVSRALATGQTAGRHRPAGSGIAARHGSTTRRGRAAPGRRASGRRGAPCRPSSSRRRRASLGRGASGCSRAPCCAPTSRFHARTTGA